jgi:hypothetical protein
MIQDTTAPTPLLVHATLILVALNFAILLWFSICPNTSQSGGLRPAPQTYDDLADKGSPFEPARIEKMRTSSKLPRKLEPIMAQIIPEETIPPSGSGN